MSKNIPAYHLCVLVGVPGSGKSTFAKEHCWDIPVVSRDTIRFSLLEDGDSYFDKEGEVYRTFIEKIVEACKETGHAVVDSTMTTRRSRIKLLRDLDKYIGGEYDVEIVEMTTPFEVCAERNAKREGLRKVPQGAMARFFKLYESPHSDEHESIKWVVKY